MEINNETIGKGLEAVANLAKMGANVTDISKNQEKNSKKDNGGYRGGNSTNQPHNQNVEVHVGGSGASSEPPKPVIIEKKPETHIHKNFPDNRALTEEECRVRELEIRLQHEEFVTKLEYEEKKEKRLMEERKEREDYERKERRAEEKRRRRNRYIFWGCVGTAFVGCLGLDWYYNSRNSGTVKNRLPAAGETGVIKTEGKVE